MHSGEATGVRSEAPSSVVTGGGRRLGVAVAAFALLLVAIVLGVVIGSAFLGPSAIWHALATPDGNTDDVIVRDMRVPRTVTAVLVGTGLGLAGALMQALTRNPLADPGLLGVNAGAGLAVVVAVGFLGLTSFSQYLWFALLGALLVSIVVYVIGFAAARSSPILLVLAGVAITAVLVGATNGLALLDPQQFNAMRGWMSGSVAGRGLDVASTMLPFLVVGIVLAAVVAVPLAQLGLGEDLATSLGVRVGATRILTAASVTLLAGVATAAAGPIVFVGLMVPHLARRLAGPRMGWILIYSAVGGALLLLLADLVARLVIWPSEAPAGVITALIGAPVLIALARKARVAS